MADFSLLSDRIRYVLDHYKKTQRALAEIAGVKPPSVSAWLKGTTLGINSQAAKRISEALNVSLNWLIDGKGDPDPKLSPIEVFDDANPDECQDNDQIVFIKDLNMAFGCGHGHEPTWEEANISKPRAYRLSWFQRHGRKPENCVTAYVDGDSMEPTLCDGDSVLIDTSDKYRIDSGHVYAFYIFDELKIKRLYRNSRGDVTVVSDNPTYEREVFRHDDESIVMNLIGRVIEKSGSSNL